MGQNFTKQLKGFKLCEIVDTKSGPAMVTDIVNFDHVKIVFLDPPIHIAVVRAGNLRKGLVRNKMRPSVAGIGYVGYGPYSTTESHVYNRWSFMLNRVYQPPNEATARAYAGVTVCEEWHNYQNYAEWFLGALHANKDWDKVPFRWVVDKDLWLPGNKVYSPYACRLVPQPINTLMNNPASGRTDLPLGVTRHGQRFAAHCSSFDTGPQFLGYFDTIALAQSAYWRTKVDAVRAAAYHFYQWIPEDLREFLVNFRYDDADWYFGESTWIWVNDRKPRAIRPGDPIPPVPPPKPFDQWTVAEKAEHRWWMAYLGHTPVI